MQRATLRTGRGFTLIEVLVAMTIMALIAIMSWQGVDGIVRARNISQERLEKVLRLNTVLAQWEQDLLALHETDAVKPIEFLGASMTLTRRAPGGVQVVVWSLRNGEWKRWAGPAVTTINGLQQQWLSSRRFTGDEAGQLRVLSNMSEWQVYYFIGNAWANAQSSPGQAVPEGVRMVITLAGSGPFNGQVVREIALTPRPPAQPTQ